jgi:spore germination protein PB
MNFYINQTICINYLRVEAVSNSSVLQIGSAGIIKPLSNLYNTGGYTEPAPQIETETPTGVVTEEEEEESLVPLTSPTIRNFHQ